MLRDQYRTLPFPVFERLHLNRFPSSGTNRAYSGRLVARLPPSGPHFDPELPTVLALDASWTRDTTALVMDQRDGRGRHTVLGPGCGRKDAAIGHIDHEAVEAKIVELCEDLQRACASAATRTTSRARCCGCEHEFGLPVEEFPQENKRMSGRGDDALRRPPGGPPRPRRQTRRSPTRC